MEEFNNGNYVLGRDLYKELGINERYSKWLKRVVAGFIVGKDYVSFDGIVIVNNGAHKTITNHKVTIKMADEIKDNYTNKLHRQRALSNHVYVVQQIGIDGIYKIGITKDVKKRLEQFNNAAPIGIKVITCIESQDSPLIEPYLHDYFKDFNSNLEWYRLSDDQLEELTTYLKVYEQIEQGNFVKTNLNLPEAKIVDVAS